MRLLYWTSLITAFILFALHLFITPIMVRHSQQYTLPIHKTLYVDRNFSDEEFAIITSAALEWHLATKELVTYDVVRMPHLHIDVDNSILIEKISPDFPEVILQDNEGDGLNEGFYDTSYVVPFIGLVPSRIDDDAYRPVIMHELGHSLGLKHNPDEPGTLMYPSSDVGSKTITEYDLQKFCELYHCDAKKLYNQ